MSASRNITGSDLKPLRSIWSCTYYSAILSSAINNWRRKFTVWCIRCQLNVLIIPFIVMTYIFATSLSSIWWGAMIFSRWFWNRGRLGRWSRKPGPELTPLGKSCSDSSLEEESETKSGVCMSSNSDPLSSQPDTSSGILRKDDRISSAVTRLRFAITLLLFLKRWITRLSTAALQSTEHQKKR